MRYSDHFLSIMPVSVPANIMVFGSYLGHDYEVMSPATEEWVDILFLGQIPLVLA